MTSATLEQFKEFVYENRNKLGHCPGCNSNIADRAVAIYQELVDAMYQVYCWCGKNRRHEFEMRDIRHLLGRNEYARFGDLVRFGGIVYKPKVDGESRKALYGMNMTRAREFFAGKRDIPMQIVLNQITNEIIEEKRVHVNEISPLADLIGPDGLYDHEKEPPPSLF